MARRSASLSVLAVPGLVLLLFAKLCGSEKADPAAVTIDPVRQGKIAQCASSAELSESAIIVHGAGRNICADESGLFWVSKIEAAGSQLWGIRHRHPDGHETVVIAPRAGEIWQLATDERYVYFSSGKRLLRVSKKGGAPRALAALKDGLSSIVQAKGTLFWSENKEIYEMPVEGGRVQKLATAESWVSRFVVNDSRAFWIDRGASYELEVMRAGPSGAPDRFIVPDAYFGGVRGVGFDDEHVYWNEGKGFFRRALAGGVPQALAGHQDSEVPLHVDGAHVYGVYPSWDMKGAHGASIFRFPKTGGCTEVVATMRKTPDVAFDENYVYWSDSTTGDISAVRKSQRAK